MRSLEPYRPGLIVTKTEPYVFICGICGRRERADDAYAPACTGPGWTDEHPMEPMRLISK